MGICLTSLTISTSILLRLHVQYLWVLGSSEYQVIVLVGEHLHDHIYTLPVCSSGNHADV